MKRIPLSIPNLCGREKEYVIQALDEQWVSTAGHYITTFENKMSEYLKVESCSACQSGTAGLHIALKLAGVGLGDAVIVPTLTFIAAVNPVAYLGASPIFMDCADDLCMDSAKLKRYFEEETLLVNGYRVSKATNKPIKAILVVHVFGNGADMEGIMEVAETYGVPVVEDATEALGTYYLSGKYKGQYAGTIGDFGVYSFNGNKIITTGGGGMLTAKNTQQVERARYYFTQAKDDTVNYTHHDIGYNYRMTSLQAAMGLGQLELLESFIATKHKNYDAYSRQLNNLKGLSVHRFNEGVRSNKWFYALRIDERETGVSRDQLQQALFKVGVETRTIWGLIHEQRPYLGSECYQIEKAQHYHDSILNIPCSTNLTAEEVNQVVEAIQLIVQG